MLTDYKGPANHPEVLKYLVGETIKGAFKDREGKIWIVLGSGAAMVLGTRGGGAPVYWSESPADVEIIVAERRAEIERYVAELRNLYGIAGLDGAP